MADSSSIPPDIVRETAPILFGPMINWALYGVLCVQTYVYSYNFPDDRRAIKFLDSPTIDAFISLIVQGFFCYRIWTLNKRMWWLCLIIAILSVTQAVGGAWGGIKSATLGRYAVIKSALYLWLVTSAVVDILIAVAMTLLLRQVRGNEGRFSNYVFPRVVRLTIETNSLTASVAIVSLILYVAFPNEIYYTCPTGVIGKLYSNTLFVTLNNRIYFRDHPSPVSLGDSANVARSNRGGRRLVFSPRRRPSQSTTGTGTSIRLHELPPPTDPEKGKSDFVTTTSPVTL
ncbi:hypothetical protein EDB87DRAFT_1573837 [Lactarius vividus]|nr:hypothetical protein EDB87DRAFT_1573837 [Lactarius vividus]